MTINLQEHIDKANKEDYKDACERWKAAHQLLKEMEVEEKKARDELLKLSGGERMENGVKIKLVVKTGNVEWSRIPEVNLLDKNYLDEFRKPNSEYYKVSPY